MSGALGRAGAYPDPVRRRLITMTLMAATIMSALDTTIANVALPHIQGSVSASQEEITWVLTSYIVASAIAIPLCGWIANRFGRKRLMLVSILGFTVTSVLCGIATNLDELVIFRLLQGVFGAALVPMSQAILLDINPPERHGQAMAIFGMGSVLAPIVGPLLGGWLTDSLSWRWVFFVNVPVGIATFFAMSAFVAESRDEHVRRLDFFGFAMLALAIASLQLMLDRGQQLDWFHATEICVEAALAGFFFYAFVVHMLTARLPFVDLKLFRDRNFTVACFLGFMVGVMLFSVLALLPSMLQQLMGYSVILTGFATAPRGVGTMLSMLLVGPLMQRVDARLLMGVGLGITAISMFLMSGFSLQMDDGQVMVSGFLSGIGNGLLFVPLSTMAFATLSPHFRNEGAAIYTLIRNMGSAVGISVLQTMTYRNAATVHARLIEGVRPDNPALDLRLPGFDFDAPGAVAALNAEISRQASMVSYVDGYWVLFVTMLAIAPLILMMRPPRRGVRDDKMVVHVD
jgi:DHA2 family multidrug resistance protein